MPEFYVIFARKIPKFYTIIAGKIFSRILGRHVPPFSPLPPSAMSMTFIPTTTKNKKLSYCWETVRRESMPRIAEMDVEMTT